MPDSLTGTLTAIAPSDGKAPSDGVARLVRDIAAGDTSAFAEFYESWFDRALELARVLTRRDDHFCLDVVQDSMMKAAKAISPRLGILTRADMDRWMTRVVHTTALDLLRKESRQRERERRSVSDSATSGRSTPVRNRLERFEGPSGHDAALLAERIEWVRRQVDALDTAERAILAARYGNEQAVSRIAHDQAESEGSMTGRLSRLIGRLRRAGKEWFRDE